MRVFFLLAGFVLSAAAASAEMRVQCVVPRASVKGVQQFYTKALKASLRALNITMVRDVTLKLVPKRGQNTPVVVSDGMLAKIFTVGPDGALGISLPDARCGEQFRVLIRAVLSNGKVIEGEPQTPVEIGGTWLIKSSS